MGDYRIDVPPEVIEMVNRRLIRIEIGKNPDDGSVRITYSKTQGEAIKAAVGLAVTLLEECNDGGLDSERVFKILKEQFPELISDNRSMKEEENMTPEAP